MAEELIQHPRSGRASGAAREDIGTFPAGTAIGLLTVSFAFTRAMLQFTLERRWAMDAAVFTGVAGALLGCVSIVRELLHAAGRGGLVARGWAGLRAIFALPLLALLLSSVTGEPSPVLQWAALAGVTLTVITSLAGGIVVARGMWVARAALALLLVGEVIELAWPAAAVAEPPESFWPQLFAHYAPLSEVCALAGSLAAAVWAFLATQRTAGASRTRAFAGLPLAGGAMLSLRFALAPARTAVNVARALFGTRFDLILERGHSGAVSTGGVLGYLLVPELLLFAACISAAALGLDRGAAGRRIAGWLCVLVAGFGTLRLMGPMLPIRLTAVSLAAVLLEQAAAREAADRRAG